MGVGLSTPVFRVEHESGCYSVCQASFKSYLRILRHSVSFPCKIKSFERYDIFAKNVKKTPSTTPGFEIEFIWQEITIKKYPKTFV